MVTFRGPWCRKQTLKSHAAYPHKETQVWGAQNAGLVDKSILSTDLTDGQDFALRTIIPSDSGILVLRPPIPDASATSLVDHHLIPNLSQKKS